MEEKSTFWKSAMTNGLYLGIAVVLFGVILYVLGQSLNPAVSWISYVILAAGVYLSQLNYRNKELNGSIKYSTCLGFGVAVMLFAGIIQTVYIVVLFKLDPSLLDQLRVIQEEAMIKQGVSEEDIEKVGEMMGFVRNPFIIAISGLLTFALLGFIISLITSIFVKKDNQDNAFEEAMEEVNQEE